jgi:hypothetical protein
MLATSQAPINSENYTSLGLGKCNQRDWMGLSPVKVFAKIMWTSFKQLRNLKTGKFFSCKTHAAYQTQYAGRIL